MSATDNANWKDLKYKTAAVNERLIEVVMH